MAGGYEAVIIGAGHNGLTSACYVAKAGLKVLVLEQYSDIHASGYLIAKLNPGPQELDFAAHGRPMRPIPELGSYRSPIASGAGSHPGSGVTMAPGRNAARIICADPGLAFPR
jgi:phytoene dehydrogenase-like protein